MVGLGEPRVVNAGMVGGSYFQVMGLRSELGRLPDARDDGPEASGAVVLTYRFWSTALKSDRAVDPNPFLQNGLSNPLDSTPNTVALRVAHLGELTKVYMSALWP